MAIRCSSCSQDGQGKDGKGNPTCKAVQTFVKTGERFDGRVAILRGLKPGDLVVASGQIKLQNGAPVRSPSTRPAAARPPPSSRPIERKDQRHALHRHLRPPAGAGTVVSLLILLLGLRVASRPADPAVPAS